MINGMEWRWSWSLNGKIVLGSKKRSLVCLRSAVLRQPDSDVAPEPVIAGGYFGGGGGPNVLDHLGTTAMRKRAYHSISIA